MLRFRLTRRRALVGVAACASAWFGWHAFDEHYFSPRVRIDRSQQVMTVRMPTSFADSGLVPDQDGDGLPDILLKDPVVIWPTLQDMAAKREYRRVRGVDLVQLLSSRPGAVLQEWGGDRKVEVLITQELGSAWECVHTKLEAGEWQCASPWHDEVAPEISQRLTIGGRDYSLVLDEEWGEELSRIDSNGEQLLDIAELQENYGEYLLAWHAVLKEGHALRVPRWSDSRLSVIEERFAPERKTIEHSFEFVENSEFESGPERELRFESTVLDAQGHLQLLYSDARTEPPHWFSIDCTTMTGPVELGVVPKQVPMPTSISHEFASRSDALGLIVAQAFISDQPGNPLMLRVTRPGKQPVTSEFPLELAGDGFNETYQAMLASGCGFWFLGVQSVGMHAVPDQDGDGVSDWFVNVEIACDKTTHLAYSVVSGAACRPISRLR